MILDLPIVFLPALINAYFGARWRRWLGSHGSHRYVKIPVGALLAWPLWIAFPWWVAIIGTGLCILFFIIGHTVDSNKVWLRYGPFALAYVLARKFWRDEWNRPPEIDGWMSAGEYGLGGSFFFTFTLGCLAYAVWS